MSPSRGKKQSEQPNPNSKSMHLVYTGPADPNFTYYADPAKYEAKIGCYFAGKITTCLEKGSLLNTIPKRVDYKLKNPATLELENVYSYLSEKWLWGKSRDSLFEIDAGFVLELDQQMAIKGTDGMKIMKPNGKIEDSIVIKGPHIIIIEATVDNMEMHLTKKLLQLGKYLYAVTGEGYFMDRFVKKYTKIGLTVLLVANSDGKSTTKVAELLSNYKAYCEQKLNVLPSIKKGIIFCCCKQ